MRHNIVVSAGRRVLLKACCPTSVEPPYSGLGGGGDAGQRRGDIFTIKPDGSVVVIDVVVTHPAAASYADAASKRNGWAAARAEAEKRREFEAMGVGGGYEFVPFAVESFGRLGVAASRFLSGLGDLAAADGRVSKAQFVRNAKRELSVALCRGNALAYQSSMGTIVRARGRAYQPPLAVSTAG
jgi:hypothetical protein